MASKRKKRTGGRKRGKSRKSFLIIAFFVAGTITLAVIAYISGLTNPVSIPLYEEIYSRKSDLRRVIGKIDRTVYESLFREGIPEKNIFFPGVSPRQEREREWEFTELLIRLSRQDSLPHLERSIGVALSPLRPTVRHKIEKRSDKEIVYHIFALGFYTHKIRVVRDSCQKGFYTGPPKVAIIIDDLGYDLGLAESFIRLGLPLGISVLPLAPHTNAIVDLANKRGCELILHLPMEPKNYPDLNPGPGALLVEMREVEIRNTLDKHLKRVSGARGVNNHMGSLFTERKSKMAVVLGELRKRGLFYVDSRTTSQTVALNVAKQMDVPAASRSVFLDNDLSPKAMRYQMQRLLGMARHSGEGIGIGHPHRETLNFLRNYLPRLKSEVKVVRASKIAG